MKKLTIAIIFALLFIGVVFRWWHDRGIFYPSDFVSDFPNAGNYMIDSNSILIELKKGNTDVFKPTFELDTSAITPLGYGSFAWTQADYHTIFDAFHFFIWEESLADWQVYQIDFGRGCQNNVSGFDAASVILFKKNEKQKSLYVARFLGIYPLKGIATWGEGEFRSPLFGWNSVDLNSLRVTADKALQIAEDKGGQIFRSHANNKCTTSISLKPNPGSYDDWLVYYSDEAGIKNFLMWVDPFSGKYTLANRIP